MGQMECDCHSQGNVVMAISTISPRNTLFHSGVSSPSHPLHLLKPCVPSRVPLYCSHPAHTPGLPGRGMEETGCQTLDQGLGGLALLPAWADPRAKQS